MTAPPESEGKSSAAAAGTDRFAAYLRRCRHARRLSLRQVERLSEAFPERISNSYLAYCETGRLLPSLGKLITLSKVLGIPLQSFTERLELDRELGPGEAVHAAAPWTELRDEGIREAEAGRLQHAYTCFERALDRCGTGPAAAGPRADLRMDMAIVLKRMSRHHTARELLEEVLSEAPFRRDGDRADRALILLAGVLREMGRLPIAAMIAKEACQRAAASGDALREAHASSVLGCALYDLGQIQEAATLYESAVKVYRQQGDPAKLVCNLGNLGNCLVRSGRFNEGMRLLAEAEELARRNGFLRQTADILGYMGAAHMEHAAPDQAEHRFFQSNKIARAHGFNDVLFGNVWHLRRIALKRARDAEALDHMRTLRYLRTKVEGTSAEIRAFDRVMEQMDQEEA
ncbi:MAG TPA: tetratricopeptide repeat protein, partial [Candidatus Polarisedimenticolia bacterium]|nr:tetratricopeptide repeat protein [Candidatus Polarisedimenticolia bacterium]